MKDTGEMMIVDGCKVRIRYAKQGNPAVIKTMRELLEQQKLVTNRTEKLTKTCKI